MAVETATGLPRRLATDEPSQPPGSARDTCAAVRLVAAVSAAGTCSGGHARVLVDTGPYDLHASTFSLSVRGHVRFELRCAAFGVRRSSLGARDNCANRQVEHEHEQKRENVEV